MSSGTTLACLRSNQAKRRSTTRAIFWEVGATSKCDLILARTAYTRPAIGREWKLYTFSCEDRPDPEKLYVLSIDAARMAGHADSSSFVRKAGFLVRVKMTDKEREKQIDLGKVAASMRYRSVTMITARSCFKYMGAKAVKGERSGSSRIHSS